MRHKYFWISNLWPASCRPCSGTQRVGYGQRAIIFPDLTYRNCHMPEIIMIMTKVFEFWEFRKNSHRRSISSVKVCHCLPSAGGWAHHAADPLDASGEHHVPEVHHWERHLELRRGLVGDLHLRQAALVPAVQQWGAQPAHHHLIKCLSLD